MAVEFGSFEALLLPNFVAMAAVTRATCKKSAKILSQRTSLLLQFRARCTMHVHNGEQEEQVVQASCKEKILTAPVQEAAEGVYEAEAVPESASKRKLYDGVPKIRIQ